MSEYNIKETLEEVTGYIGGKVKEGLETKEDTFRFTIMPTASADNLGQVVQYLGNSTQTYTNGYFYKCVGTEEGGTVTYAWENVVVQDISGVPDSRIGEEITGIDVEKDNGVNRPYINVNPSKVYSKLGEWDDMTDFLKREIKAHYSDPQTSTYTAEGDEKVLAICWSSIASNNEGAQPVEVTTTGEFAYTPITWKNSDSEEADKAGGGFGFAQASLADGESVTLTSGVYGAGGDAILGCFYFLPLTSFVSAELVHTNAIWLHNPHTYTIPSDGHYVCVCAGYGYSSHAYGTIQFNDVELNGEAVENQFTSDTTSPQFAIAEFVAKQGDTLEASLTSTGNTKSACFLLKLTESGTPETKIELARKDEIVDVDVPSKLTSADIAEIKSQWNPSGGGGGGGGSSEVIYDVEEHEIGKWRQLVDGVKKQKPLYQRTIIFTGGTGAFETSFEHHIVDWHGNFARSTGLQGVVPYYTAGNDYFIIYKDPSTNNLMQYQAGNNGADVEVIISYTKSTDSWEVVS